MKITMYALLGMIKDGKAPSKIKYDDMIWEYDGDYYSSKNNVILEEYCNLTTSLNDEVEILEEEKKIPEKFKVHSLGDKDENGNFVSSPFPTDEEFMNKINDIIDYFEYLKSKGE